MVKFFRDKESGKSPDVEKEARSAYQFIEHQGRRLKVWELWFGLVSLMYWTGNSHSEIGNRWYENQQDYYMYKRRGFMIDIEWRFKEIAQKELGVSVLKRVIEMADQKIAGIKRDYSEPADAMEIHKIAKDYASGAIWQKEFDDSLTEMFRFRLERERQLEALRP